MYDFRVLAGNNSDDRRHNESLPSSSVSSVAAAAATTTTTTPTAAARKTPCVKAMKALLSKMRDIDVTDDFAHPVTPNSFPTPEQGAKYFMVRACVCVCVCVRACVHGVHACMRGLVVACLSSILLFSAASSLLCPPALPSLIPSCFLRSFLRAFFVPSCFLRSFFLRSCVVSFASSFVQSIHLSLSPMPHTHLSMHHPLHSQ